MSRTILVAGLSLLLLVACDRTGVVTGPGTDPEIDAELRQALAPYGVIPIGPVPHGDPALVELGRALMFDRILSGNRDIACATCHHPSTHLTDGRSLPVGTGGVGLGPSRTPAPGHELVPRNAPTLLNQGLRPFYLLWDGRVSGHGAQLSDSPPGVTFPSGLPSTLAAQAMLPVLDRREMRGAPGDVDVHGQPNELAALADDEAPAIWDALMDRLLAIPEYEEMFDAAFPHLSTSSLGFQHAATAIAAFITDAFTKTDSPFDRYLAGDDAALERPAKRGGLLFFGARSVLGDNLDDPLPSSLPCSGCHGGALLGGQTFANIGTPQIGPGVGAAAPLDFGRGGLMEEPVQSAYRFAFRAPPLRNVELTAPYMHNGVYGTLDEVVRHYSDAEEALRSYDGSGLEPALRNRVHDDAGTVNDILSSLDHRLRSSVELSDEEMDDLVAFLRSLTDPAARELDHVVPDRVPSGLPVDGM